MSGPTCLTSRLPRGGLAACRRFGFRCDGSRPLQLEHLEGVLVGQDKKTAAVRTKHQHSNSFSHS